MKVLGSEIKKFRESLDETDMLDSVEYDELAVDDILELIDNEKYDLKNFGYVVDGVFDTILKFETAFKKWKIKQTTETLIIVVDKEKASEIKSKITEMKGVKKVC